ncbi:MAG: hypothetical protein PHS41_00475 [Victivallaceae bacterium]|nr:hypothetical protein [Victivallaceae bacterium]
MLIVGVPQGKISNGRFIYNARISCSGKIPLDAIHGNLHFSIPEAYADYAASESSDCFMLALLYFAMRRGEDLHLEGAVNKTLLEQINSDVIPLLVAYRDKLQPIRVTAETKRHFPIGKNVGTGFSGGVDSFYSVKKHLSDEEPLDTLFFFDVGTHGQGRTEEELRQTRTKFRARFAAFAPAPQMLNLPYIPIDGNMPSFLPDNILAEITLMNAASIYFVSGRIHRYFMASAGFTYDRLFDYYQKSNASTHIDMSLIDPILTPLLSTSEVKLIADGTALGRIAKIDFISDFPAAQKFLNVCNSTATVERNCSHCLKCRRTMTDLEILEKLDDFHESFDVEYYRKECRKRDFAMLMHPTAGDQFSRLSYAYAAAHGIDLRARTTRLDILCAILHSSIVYTILKKVNLLATVKRLGGRK